jgi:hypothetical protein
MKKWVASLIIGMFVLLAVAPAANAAGGKGNGRGGFMGFIAGCCFGVRAGSAYNDGKELHFREWCTIIPYVGLVFSIWNGIDCAGGTTTSDLAAKYGATYY